MPDFHNPRTFVPGDIVYMGPNAVSRSYYLVIDLVPGTGHLFMPAVLKLKDLNGNVVESSAQHFHDARELEHDYRTASDYILGIISRFEAMDRDKSARSEIEEIVAELEKTTPANWEGFVSEVLRLGDAGEEKRAGTVARLMRDPAALVVYDLRHGR